MGNSANTMGDAENAQQPEQPQAPGKLALWLTGAAAVSVLVAAIIWLYLLNRSSVHLNIAPTLPPVSTEKSAPLAAASITTPPPVLVNTADTADAKHPDSKAAVPPATEGKRKASELIVAPASSTARLNEKQTERLVARLRQERAPASCADGEDRVKRQANVSTAQAREIAKRAYPQFCAPVVATPEATPAPPPKKVTRTIDQTFKQRAAAECEEGLRGLICQEKIRNRLCEGHWSTTLTPGQRICQQADTTSHD